MFRTVNRLICGRNKYNEMCAQKAACEEIKGYEKLLMVSWKRKITSCKCLLTYALTRLLTKAF